MPKCNQNRPGYKETKVGWIPNNWSSPVLGEQFQLSSGDTRPKNITESMSEECQIPVYGGNGIMGFSNIWNEQGKKIVIGRVGEKCGCIHLISDKHFITDNALYTCEWVKESCIDYFAYYLTYCNLSRLRNKGGQPLISQKPIYSLRISLPPLPEQKRIAEILSAWDRAIEQTRKLIDARKHLKKGLIQQLLTGRMRFSEFIKSIDSLSSHFYDYPKDWQHPRILEIAKEVTNRNWEKADYPVISCSKHEGFVNSLEYFGKKVFSDDTSNYKIIEKYQFGFPANHVEEGSIGLLTHVDRGILSPIYIVFEIDRSAVFPQYLYSLLKTELYKHIFSSNTNASVNRRGSLRWKEFSKIRVPLPAMEEQIKIQSTMDSIDKEIDQLTKKKCLISDQKKSLMQKLLTGEIRVNVAN